MNITIGKPCAICEKGSRFNNEDFIYPSPEAVSLEQRLFIVCDGLGGNEKGEVASSLAAESIQSFFSSFLEGDPTPAFIQKAIQYTEARFDEYVQAYPEAKGMATTLTLLYLGKSGVTLAHIGDSRIYQFRKGVIRYQTEDHSLINSLCKLGKITHEEKTTHPQKNVILRAIQGSKHPVEVDVALLRNIEPGDYFFMCTDGVLERLSDEYLSEIFTANNSTELIKDAIMEECNCKTRDNFSFYLLPVQNVREHVSVKQNILSFFYSFV